MRPIHVIGGGLAGSEAAWQAAEAGVPVVLHEMRPTRMTAAHHTARRRLHLRPKGRTMSETNKVNTVAFYKKALFEGDV